MKKTIFVLALGMFFVPAISYGAFDLDLRYGSSGAEVFELQEFLTAEGVYAGPITGNFYSLTLAGVKAFQAKVGVQPVSGFFGPLTRAEANKALAVALEDSDEEAAETPPVVTEDKPRLRTSSRESDDDTGDEEEEVEDFDFEMDIEVGEWDADDERYTVTFSSDAGKVTEAHFDILRQDGSKAVDAGTLTGDTTLDPGNYTWKATATKDGQTVTKEGSFTVEDQ